MERIISVFGITYYLQHNGVDLTENLNTILLEKEQVLRKIKNFLETPDNKYLKLTETDINLLEFNPTITTKEPSTNQEYYSGKDLELFNIIRKIITRESPLTEEDIKILQLYIRNKLIIEDIIKLSEPNSILLDKRTLKVLLDISSTKTLTVGHIISMYETLYRELNLGTYTLNPKLQYKIVA